MQWGRDSLGIKCYCAIADVKNLKSVNVLKKLGMEFNYIHAPGTSHEVAVFSMPKTDGDVAH